MAAEAEALLDLRRGSSQAASVPDPPRCQNGRPWPTALTRSPFLSTSLLNDCQVAYFNIKIRPEFLPQNGALFFGG